MKNMFRKIVLVGALNLGWVAFAEEEKAENKSVSEESIQVVCPVGSEENCDGTETLTTDSTESK